MKTPRAERDTLGPLRELPDRQALAATAFSSMALASAAVPYWLADQTKKGLAVGCSKSSWFATWAETQSSNTMSLACDVASA